VRKSQESSVTPVIEIWRRIGEELKENWQKIGKE
jgi:hypothetical protein